MAEDCSSLRVSTVIKQFDEFLEKYEMSSSPVNCENGGLEGSTTFEQFSEIPAACNRDSNGDNEWQNFMQNGIGKPGGLSSHSAVPTNRDEDGCNHGNNQLTNGETGIMNCNSGTIVDQSRTADLVLEKLTKCSRSRESILVSEAFNFLPSYEHADDVESPDSICNDSSQENITHAHCGQDSQVLNQDKCQTTQNENHSKITHLDTTNMDNVVRESILDVDVDVPENIPDDDVDVLSGPIHDTSVLERYQSTTNSILRDKQSEADSIDRDQRLVSEAFQFIRDLESGDMQGVVNETSDDEIRESRIISSAFKFLASEEESFSEQHADKKLSTVQEGDDDDTASQTLSDDITDTTDISDTDANMTDLPGMNEPPTIKISAPDGAGVVMRHQCEGHVTGSRSASLSDQSSQISDSEDDDDEVHIMPGAWRNSKFAYIGDVSDTASESSATSSPRLSPAPVHADRMNSRPVSIYPPPASSTQESKTLSTPSNAVSIRTIGSETDLNNRMDSTESVGRSEEEGGEAGLDQSNDSDVFEGIEQELAAEYKTNKKGKGKKTRYAHKRQDSTDTTLSEKEYRANYRSLKRTRILRDASFGKADSKQKLVREVCREIVVEMVGSEREFGFHIWGSNPVLVSTVTQGSAAERSGLQIGDVLVTVNSINISEASTKDVVQITGQGTRRVVLGISGENMQAEIPLCCGYLSKQCGNFFIKKWRKRWVELKADHCLYYYKQNGDVDPLGAVPVVNYTVTKAPEVNNDWAFKLTKYNAKTYYFSALIEMDMSKWADAISKAAQHRNKAETWLDISSHNVSLPALAIRHPDCHGYLHKMGNGTRSWRRRYCVLKDACLYYYLHVNSSTAKGVAHFHGYSVQGSMPYNKRHGFMLVPPEPEMRTFYFHAENETEQKRWLTAFQDSISKWIMIDE